MTTTDSQLLVQAPGKVAALRRRHILDVDDFNESEFDLVFQTTDAMKDVLAREIKKVPALRGKTVVTLFYEASTRTRMSFEVAGKMLSADVVNLTASASSVTKGESLVDTVKTIQAMGIDVLVIRHSSSGAPYLVAQQVGPEVSVINGGDGWHAHPTQALLDAYTIRERLGNLRGRKIAIIGDVLHSRVARSNLWALTALGAEVVLCGPPTLIPRAWGASSGTPLSNSPPQGGGGFEPWVTYELREALRDADVVMALRLQRERQEDGLLPHVGEYIGGYQITPERLRWCKPGALVMHPGPVNEGIEIASELVRDVQSVIDRQVTNGVAVRMALLYLLVGGPAE